jgi:nucleoside-diphosphate-sugar epimerase
MIFVTGATGNAGGAVRVTRAARSTRHDVALIDIEMPSLDGIRMRPRASWPALSA